jgi:hypothetical protein
MSATGDQWAEQVMDSVRGNLGVRKSATATAELQIIEAAIGPLCKAFGEFYDQVVEHTAHTEKVLAAIQRETPEQAWVRQMGSFNPGQWQMQRVPEPAPEHVRMQ